MQTIKCSICRDPARRVAVDSALLARKPERTVATIYGFSSGAIHRHKTRCLGRALDLVIRDDDSARAGTLLADLGRLAKEAERLQQVAEASGELRTALSCLSELRQLLALRAKTLTPQRAVTQNLSLHITYGNERGRAYSDPPTIPAELLPPEGGTHE